MDPDLLDVPAEQWERAKQRERLIRPLAEAKDKGVLAHEQVARVAASLGISRQWTYELVNRYREKGRLSALLPRKRGYPDGNRRLAPEVEELIGQKIRTFYAAAERPPVHLLVEEVRHEAKRLGLQAPAWRSIKRRLEAFDQDFLVRRRHGAKAARARRPAKSYDRAKQPLELVEIDHTIADVIIVDDQGRNVIERPPLSLALDVCTRCVLGYYLAQHAPSTLSVAVCLSHAVLEKPPLRLDDRAISWPCHGLPATLRLDNAREFKSHALRRGCEEHGIALRYRPVATPRFGGHVERLMGTLMRRCHLLPGTTFSNPQERGDYPSEAKACMTLSELDHWLRLEIARYHNEVHSALGTTPLDRWRMADEQGFRPRMPRHGDRFQLDFLPFEQRKLRRDGVHLHNIGYWADVLTTMIGRVAEKVVVKYDPRDLSRVWVRDREGAYWPLNYKDLRRPPISLWEHRRAVEILNERGRTAVDEDLIFAVVHEQRRLVDQAKAETRRARQAAAKRPGFEEPQTGQATAATVEIGDLAGPVEIFPVEVWE